MVGADLDCGQVLFVVGGVGIGDKLNRVPQCGCLACGGVNAKLGGKTADDQVGCANRGEYFPEVGSEKGIRRGFSHLEISIVNG